MGTVAIAYALGLYRMLAAAARSRAVVIARGVAFAAGLLALAVALFSPLDRWGPQIFAAHMVQHELLMLVAAPLLVLGRPLVTILWALPQRARTGTGYLARNTHLRRSWRVLSGAGLAWMLHAVALWGWHIPRLFNEAVRNPTLHELQHLTFVFTAALFWAGLFEERRREHRGAAILYLFTTTVHTSVLGALITFAARAWYTTEPGGPASWGLTALEDQQLGGLIMWVPGSLAYMAGALYLLARWIAVSERALGAGKR
jgi:putative membrane protein